MKLKRRVIISAFTDAMLTFDVTNWSDDMIKINLDEGKFIGEPVDVEFEVGPEFEKLKEKRKEIRRQIEEKNKELEDLKLVAMFYD